MLFEKKFQQNDKNLYIFDNFGEYDRNNYGRLLITSVHRIYNFFLKVQEFYQDLELILLQEEISSFLISSSIK